MPHESLLLRYLNYDFELCVRCLYSKNFLALKIIGFFIIVTTFLLLQNTDNKRKMIIRHRHHQMMFNNDKLNSTLSFDNQTILKPIIDSTYHRLTTQYQYLDPFLGRRVQFSHNNERRTAQSEKWCKAQTKYVRPIDLEQYKCMNIKRIGGKVEELINVPNENHRVDGAYFFCEDLIKYNNCLVVSIGVGNDDSFDDDIQESYACRVFSFDPYQEPEHVRKLRKTQNQVIIKITQTWTFYRLGITASAVIDNDPSSIGTLLPIQQLIEYVKLDDDSSIIIHILKIDIDNGNEWHLLDDQEFMTYVCKHVKQLLLKTKPIHSKRFMHYRIFTLKLTKCFSLLRRDPRLYLLMTKQRDNNGDTQQTQTEWQLTSFKLDIGLFCDEIDLAMYLLIYGDLYLVNTKL
ncbi:unnamed protein product [Didymodactylos carnosus]|uniref:Methyltransferase domain-containing protein n=1 Tax=Didymodactylos carnosus TaxID=1234261 RepID=A0A813RVB1_9BILA|nr:unnamed protein product [Didymodactylos carnosus]CAF0788125.1 unnamed protein product [Didymodactylos carnosus]CAF3516416.1 unnamed protein product [Didymodactylos carnosus]CAF3572161.1 unnamed protein product [Didymodactylos carnosus]